MFRTLNLRWKFALSNAAVVSLAVLITAAIALNQLNKDNTEQLQRSLENKLTLVSELLSNYLHTGSDDQLRQQIRHWDAAIGARLTLIDHNGTVIADSRQTAQQLDNHRQRPEIKEAATDGRGYSQRYSTSVNYAMMYVATAVRGTDNSLLGFVRVSYPLTEVAERQWTLFTHIVVAGLIGLLVAIMVGIYTAGRISRPLLAITQAATAYREGDFAQRLPETAKRGDAFALLAQSFNTLAEELASRLSIITDERNRLQAVLSALNEGVIAVDQQQRVLLYNQPAAQLLDLPQQVNKVPLWELCRQPQILEQITAVLHDSDRRQQVIEVYTSARPSQATTVEVHTATFGDEQGHSKGAVTVLHDISERRLLEAMRRDFVANVSHELKTPLAAIRGLVETVLDDPDMPTDMRQRFIAKVSDQCLRLSSIVMDLLTLSRADGHGDGQEREIVDFASLLRQSVHQLTTEAHNKNISLHSSIPDQPMPVRCDPELLRQAIDNLIDNAIKYSQAGGEVWVSLEFTPPGPLRCHIRDSGIGIAPKHLDRIWERFYRVDKARSREVGGTGLGLSIVRNVIRSHGGEVAVSSQLGHGSTFSVTLPLHYESSSVK